MSWEDPRKKNEGPRTLPLTISQSGSSSPRWTQTKCWIHHRMTDTVTLTICCRPFGPSDSQPAFWTGQEVSISKNSNVIWNDWFRRQSKSQSEAINWAPYFTAGILNLRRETKTWIYHTSHIQRKILHFSFTCETKIYAILKYSTRPDGGLIPKCVKSRTAFPLPTYFFSGSVPLIRPLWIIQRFKSVTETLNPPYPMHYHARDQSESSPRTKKSIKRAHSCTSVV